MRFEVNGQMIDAEEGIDIAALVASQLDSVRGVAVAVNAEIVPRSMWPSTTIADGDRVELLAASQGG